MGRSRGATVSLVVGLLALVAATAGAQQLILTTKEQQTLKACFDVNGAFTLCGNGGGGGGTCGGVTGKATISGSATTTPVTFPARADANYAVLVSTFALTGTPPGVLAWALNLTTTGFTIQITAAPGPGNVVGIAWIIPSGVCVSGAGTTNTVTKYIDGPNSIIGDSHITDDGTVITLGTPGSAVAIPAQAAASGQNCLQIDTTGRVSKTGTACGAGGGGATGPTGPAGAPGPVGPTGPSGVTGPTGPTLIRRNCSIVIGSDNGPTLQDADLGPQTNQCQVPAAGTVAEVAVSANAGTPSVLVRTRHCATFAAGTCATFALPSLLSSALAAPTLATAWACSNLGGTVGINTGTTCAATLVNTAVAPGDSFEVTSGTAGGTARRVTVSVTYDTTQ